MSPRTVGDLAKTLLARQADADRRLAQLENKNDLGFSSIEDGRAIDEYATDGTLQASFGGQFDGSNGAFSFRGPKPLRPSDPRAEGGAGTLTVWVDGTYMNDETVPGPMDFSRFEVHVAPTPVFDHRLSTYLVDSIESPRGGSSNLVLAAGTWYVVVVARTIPGNYSDPSTAVSAVVTESADAQAIADALAQFDIDIAAMEGDLAANDTALENAKTRLTEAETDLTTAFGQIETAQTAANEAATAAATAQTTANTAKNDAATAAGIAGGKADVLIQSTTPVAAMQKATTLWIDTTGGGNKPKRWSGSAWTVVTDKAATDAATAAATAQTAAATAQTTADNAATAASTAQSTANTAKTNAATAQTAANEAATAAATAQTTANTAKNDAATAAGIAGGKADVLIQSTTPVAAMQKETTLWIDTTSGGNKPKRWSGSAWTVVTDKAATDAATAAATAQTAANNAQTTANTAKNDAATAQTAANNAQSTANTAKTNAATAQTTADNAATAASTAQTTANTAKNDAATAAGIAGGKADVLIQSTTPVAAMQKATTLWIDTTSGGNKPKRWSGSAWTVVTDKAATDAATAAATAQTAANNAATAAATAQGTANAAQTAAGNAQNTANTALASANGKTKVYRDTAAPSGSGTTIGDVWWQYADTTWTRVIGEWFWSGATTGWQKRSLSHETISSVDLGTLTVIGQSTLADVVALEMSVQIAKVIELDVERLRVTGTSQLDDAVANSIVTKYFATRRLNSNRVMVGKRGNWIPWFLKDSPPSVEPHTAITGSLIVQSSESHSGKSHMYVSNPTVTAGTWTSTIKLASGERAGNGAMDDFDVAGSEPMVLEAWFRLGGTYANGAPNARLSAYFRDQNGVYISGSGVGGPSTAVTWDWTKNTFEFTPPANAASVYIYVQQDKPGTLRIDDPWMQSKLDGTLIADTIYGKTLLGTRVATADTGGRIEMNGTLGEDKLFGVNDLGKTFFDMNPTTGLTMPIDESGGNVYLQLGAPLNEGNWNGTTGALNGVPVLAVRQPGIAYQYSPRIFSYEDGRSWDIRGGNIGVNQIEARLGIGRSVTANSNSSNLTVSPEYASLEYTFQDKLQIDGLGLHLSSATTVDVNGYRIDEGVGSYKRVTTFVNGWTNYAGYNPLIQYFTKPGMAALTGMLNPGTNYAHDVHIATLDPPYRPNVKQYLPFNSNFGGGTNTNYYPGVITIESSGEVRMRGIRGNGGYAVVSVEYPVTPV